MDMNESGTMVSIERIEGMIYQIRGRKVLLDRDLALLYGVETRSLVQAVKRNIGRFPKDFMFQLNDEEFKNWRSQIVISNSTKMGLRWHPYAFTEQGVAMLSSVLRSPQAVTVNIEIMRAFIRMRELLSSQKTFANELDTLKSFMLKHSHANDREFRRLWDAFEQLAKPQGPVRRIGFDLGQ